jgi:hypothetical protein
MLETRSMWVTIENIAFSIGFLFRWIEIVGVAVRKEVFIKI